jgi:hypothetical protein
VSGCLEVATLVCFTVNLVELRIREQTAAGYAALSALWEEPLPLQTQHLFYIRIAKLASLFQEGPLSL